jgi:hypothetical protein
MAKSIPTQEQFAKIEEIRKQGFKYSSIHSLCASAVIFEKDDDFWFFGFNGEIELNPKGYSITL